MWHKSERKFVLRNPCLWMARLTEIPVLGGGNMRIAMISKVAWNIRVGDTVSIKGEL